MEMHIGKEIEQKFQESGLKLAVFADKINTGERNVYSIFKRRDISADMLRKISTVLNFNFFALYEDGLDASILNEDAGKYSMIEPSISVALNVSVAKSKIDHLSDFLRDVGASAHKHGLILY